MIPPIKKNQALKEMKKIQSRAPVGAIEYIDLSEPHIRADEILCGLLVELGHKDIVEVYKGIKKWYS